MGRKGKLLVLEGPDGVGKSTLADLLTGWLRRTGVDCKYLSFPGRQPGTLGEHVWKIHHEPAQYSITDMTPASLQVLHIAAHIDAIDTHIRPALENGTWVILDRYWWSTWVYGLVSGVVSRSVEAMVTLESVHWGGIKPAAVFLIGRSQPLRHDISSNEWKRICEAYRTLVDREERKYAIYPVSNDGDVEQTLNRILDLVRPLIEEFRKARTGRPTRRTRGTSDGERGKGGQLALDFPRHRLIAASSHPAPEVFSRLAPAEPTVVLDTFWRFAAERQAIFFRRFRGSPPPWTNDPILRRFKFTNAYRASDRVSQHLIRKVIYCGDQSPEEVFFRTVLFKTFNRIETWELLETELGPVTYAEYSFSRYDKVLSQAIRSKRRIYSGAYIMPTGRSRFGSPFKHQNHLRVLELMMRDEVPKRLAELRLMRDAFELLRSYPTLGDFLAYQYVTDLNYSELTDFSEMEFVVPGPGASEGIRKCFRSLGGLSQHDIIRWMAERQADEFAHRSIDFQSLWGRPLQLIDCQNLFCEVAKYARLAHPEIRGVSKRTRIKQLFRPDPEPIEYWYPPKWGLNERVQAAGERAGPLAGNRPAGGEPDGVS